MKTLYEIKEERRKLVSFDISKYKIKHRKDTILRNCVLPELGLSIFNDSKNVQIANNKEDLE